MAEHRNALVLLQTLPGMDVICAAMLLVEIGTDMDGLRQPRPAGLVSRGLLRQRRVRRQAQVGAGRAVRVVLTTLPIAITIAIWQYK